MKVLSLVAALVLSACSSNKPNTAVPLPRPLPTRGCGAKVYTSPCGDKPTKVSNPSTDPYYLCPAMAEEPVPVPQEMPK